MKNWIFHIDTSFRHQNPVLRMASRRPDGGLDVVHPFALTAFSESSVLLDTPVIDPRETMDFLRAALNAAWELGLRPDGYLDTRESMKATAAHLEDMRAIAFHKTGAPRP